MNSATRRLVRNWLKPAACLPWCAGVCAAPVPSVELSVPRDYGYAMGDLIEYTLTVTVPESCTLETSFLPLPGALDGGLDLRSVGWEVERSQGEARYRMRMVYQLFRGVRTPEQAVVPALPLRFTGPEPLEVHTPTWEFGITPLIPPQLPDEAVRIRADLPPETLATAPHRRRLGGWLAGILAVSAWLGWRQLDGIRRPKPFGKAYRELQKLLRGPVSPDGFRSAVEVLHRALNETAGRVLFAGELDRFCAHHPAFGEVREELGDFFALSRRLFFTTPGAALSADYPVARLVGLCRRCAAAERRAP